MDLPSMLSWNWSLALIIGGVLVLALYVWTNRFDNMRKPLLFVSGLMLVITALALPMGPRPRQPLFSLHMIRHIILLMLAPPLLVAGLPGEPVHKLFLKSGAQKIGTVLLNPITAWILGIGIMWFWHTPVIFNRMVTTWGGMALLLHTIETISLLGIGLLFCSPIVFPLKEYRLPPLKGIVYLFTACWGCSLLGILITFAPPGLYHTVFSGGPAAVWGLTQPVDQQLGGLLMWVPGCIIYVSGAMVLLARWYSLSEPAYKTTAASNSQPQP